MNIRRCIKSESNDTEGNSFIKLLKQFKLKISLSAPISTIFFNYLVVIFCKNLGSYPGPKPLSYSL